MPGLGPVARSVGRPESRAGRTASLPQPAAARVQVKSVCATGLAWGMGWVGMERAPATLLQQALPLALPGAAWFKRCPKRRPVPPKPCLALPRPRRKVGGGRGERGEGVNIAVTFADSGAPAESGIGARPVSGGPVLRPGLDRLGSVRTSGEMSTDRSPTARPTPPARAGRVRETADCWKRPAKCGRAAVRARAEPTASR